MSWAAVSPPLARAQAIAARHADGPTPFAIAFELLVQAEGGYVHDPEDPGGPTKWGVSWRAVRLRDYDRDGRLDFDFDLDGDVDEWDIRMVTREHARQLFREDYWSPCRCDDFPASIAVPLGDSAYNQGPRAAVALLQRALRVNADGIVGPQTLSAAHRAKPLELLREFASHRAERYRRHPNAARWFRGWINRLVDLDRAMVALEVP